jgi:hypothetical protein
MKDYKFHLLRYKNSALTFFRTNENYRYMIQVGFFITVFSILLLSGPFALCMGAEEAVGLISRMEGQVEIIRGGAVPMVVGASAGDKLLLKDSLQTKKDAKAEIIFSDNSTVRMAEDSRIDIDEYVEGNHAVLKMPQGKVQAMVPKLDKKLAGKLAGKFAETQNKHRFEIKTPGAVAGVRGTEFFVFQDQAKAEIIVKEGTVAAFNPKYLEAVVLVKKNMMTTIPENWKPRPPIPVSAALIKSLEAEVTPPGEPIRWNKSESEKPQDSIKSKDDMQIRQPGSSPQNSDKKLKKYDLKNKGNKLRAALRLKSSSV